MDGEHDRDKIFLGDVRRQVSELGVLIIFRWMYNKKNTTRTMKSLCMKLLTPYEIHYS